VVTGELTLPEVASITFATSTIPESAIVSTTGWIYDALTTIHASINDLVSDLTNNTFGFVTRTDVISQSHVDETDTYGWISGIYNSLHSEKAPNADPEFSGTVIFSDGRTVTDYLKLSSASSTYAKRYNAEFTGNLLLFPDASNYSDYLLIYDANENY
jgi:hypothetical protein